MNEYEPLDNVQQIAIIGLSVRVVKAKNIDEFWANLKNGVESILFLSDDELIQAGVSPATVKNPKYIKACSILEDKEYFDASFFGYTPREAELLNPQIRLFHECAWEALEDAGIDPEGYVGLIGVYAGAIQNAEWDYRALFSPKSQTFGGFAASKLTGIRYLCTRLSYNLNLKGPSITIQTACSTGLVAVHLACQALLSGECDVAIAGATSLSPKKAGEFFYSDDLIFSPDGHTRSFDANAKGTLFGEGAGVAILKPLEEAIANNDHIYAIIKSSVINNDGNRKVGFTAPSVEAQVEMMRAAYHLASISPESIAYVEAHGTATPLGDPIEFEALKQAFRTEKKSFCILGSVKSNLGHLDAAAGIVGFIKAVLALKHNQIPPSLFFKVPNPEINLVDSPFWVNTELFAWESGDYPRRAAVNSLGMGGTNAHIVLEEAPKKDECSRSRDYQMILLSARNKNSLDRMTQNLAAFLEKNREINLADVAYTLQTRRKKFQFRRSLVCRDMEEAIRELAAAKSKTREYHSKNDDKKIIFMFPGQGTQHINMGLDLYREEEIFRREMDHCFAIIKPYIGFDIKDILYPSDDNREKAKEEINKVLVTPALVFIVEFSLARLLMEWGIKPDAMIGHSFGEYTAACLAGVFSLEDALKIITFRNRLMSQLPPGAMMSVPLPADELNPLLSTGIALAIDNGSSCIVSGSTEAIDAFEKEMKTKKYICQRIQISVACHSMAMNSVFDEFQTKIATLRLNPPRIPFISNVTGTWINDDEAISPAYWANHLRKTVRFADGIKELVKIENPIFLEVGPGNVLSMIAFQHLERQSEIGIMNLLKHPNQEISDISFLLDKIDKLWLYGINVDWQVFYSKEVRNCVHVPPYAFDKERYWLEPISWENLGYVRHANKENPIRNWFYAPSWSPEPSLKLNKKIELTQKNNCRGEKINWLLFLDESGIGDRLCNALEPYADKMVTVRIGPSFLEQGDNRYSLNPDRYEDYGQLWSYLKESGTLPRKIVHLWGITEDGPDNMEGTAIEDGQNRGFYSLLFLARGMEMLSGNDEIEIITLTNWMQKVTGEEVIFPVKATILGPVYVIPQEYLNIECRSIDISLSNLDHEAADRLIGLLTEDLLDGSSEKISAYRNNQKWKPVYETVYFDNDSASWALKEKGVYLITGGLGGVGYALAEEFANTCQVRLVFVGRTRLPEREEWERWVSSHDDRDSISLKIKKIRALEKMGSEVLYFSADVGDAEMVQTLIVETKKHFGAIHGVIHAAGGTKGESINLIRNLDKSKCQDQFKAKMNGLIILDRLFKDETPDFLILISSMTSFLGGWEYAAYTAANFFMDRFATHADRWITVNLDPVNLEGNKKKEFTLGIDELCEVFKYILANIKKGQIMVSKSDLHLRIKKATQALKTNSSKDSEGEISTPKETSVDFFPRPELTTPYIPPTNPVEIALVEICRELFGYDKIGIADNFFELGGDSLTLIQFIGQIQKKFDVRLHVQDIFNKEQIGELAEYIRDAKKEKYLSVEPQEQREYYPLSSAQMRLYVIQQLEEDFTGYNVIWPHQLVGTVDRKKLEEVFQKMIRRHESLRTSFHQVNGQPVQRIHENVPFEITYQDGDPTKANEIIESFVRPFDLSVPPLLRVLLIKLGENDHLLMIDIHHIICDWHSMNIFGKDFKTLYAGGTLSPLTLQYKDYSQWQNDQGQGDERKLETYWLNRFTFEIPVLQLPTDFPRQAFHDFNGERIGFAIDRHLVDEMKQALLETGTTSFMLLLAVYTILLFMYTGQEDIVVGVPTVGRNHRDLENILGMFANMLPMRNCPKPDQTFRGFLKEVKENSIQDFEHQDYPFENLVSKLNLPRHSNRTPLVETTLTKIDAPRKTSTETGTANPELELKNWTYEKYSAKFDLAIEALDKNTSIHMFLTYSTRLFKRSTIEKIKLHYLEILGQVLKNMDITLKDITLSHGFAEVESDVLLHDSGDFEF
ncbi:MAG: SDR family NAD(P)-dependent oxidoreductase [Candidatus Omnitrophota bacterium]